MTSRPSGWAIGWTTFAGVMMIMAGIWWIIAGIAAIFSDDLYVIGQEYIFEFSTTTWGWIHLLLGIVVLFAGFGLFQAAVWARTVGVIIAILQGLAAFAWMPLYPIWGIIFIAVSIAIIWALTAHGDDIVEP